MQLQTFICLEFLLFWVEESTFKDSKNIFESPCIRNQHREVLQSNCYFYLPIFCNDKILLHLFLLTY